MNLYIRKEKQDINAYKKKKDKIFEKHHLDVQQKEYVQDQQKMEQKCMGVKFKVPKLKFFTRSRQLSVHQRYPPISKQALNEFFL